jgi:hypothetical protein
MRFVVVVPGLAEMNPSRPHYHVIDNQFTGFDAGFFISLPIIVIIICLLRLKFAT